LGGLFDFQDLRVYFYIFEVILKVELILNFYHFVLKVNICRFCELILLNFAQIVNYINAFCGEGPVFYNF